MTLTLNAMTRAIAARRRAFAQAAALGQPVSGMKTKADIDYRRAMWTNAADRASRALELEHRIRERLHRHLAKATGGMMWA